MPVSSSTKAVAAAVVMSLVGLGAVSCAPMLAILGTLGGRQCAAGLSTGGEPVPLPPGDAEHDLSLRVASWNVLKSNSVANVEAGLRELSTTADVIGLQEFRPKFRSPAVRAALPGWTFSDQNTSVAIAWNADKFDLVAKDRVMEFDVTRLTSGSVGSSAGPKYLEWVQLRDKHTGGTVVVGNHHLLVGIESKGHPDRSAGKKYLGLAQRQIQVELDQVARFAAGGLPIVITKDGNWDARASAKTRDRHSPYIQAARHGLYTNWQVLGYPPRGTQSSGSRLIDSVSATTATLIPIEQTVLGKPGRRWHGSDHNPPVTALTNSGSSLSSAARRASTLTPRVAAIKGLTDPQMSVAQKIYTTTLQVAKEQRWSPADTDKAFQIAVSTAQKESTLGANPRSRQPDRNGDGGIFAQRTLPGWYGTIDQVNDPAYATRIFLLGKQVTSAAVAAAKSAGVTPAGPAGYTIPGLAQVKGWQRMSISEASHRVQRSAFPQIPSPMLAIARALLKAFVKAGVAAATAADVAGLLGSGCAPTSPTGVGVDCPATSMPAEQYDLTPDALAVTRCVAQQFPQISTIGTYASHQPDPTRAVDIMIPGYRSAAGRALGGVVRDWVQQRAAELGVDYIIWDEHIWSVQRAAEGWRTCGTAAAGCYSGPDDSAAHRNHVHVSVFGAKSVEYARNHPSSGGPGGCVLDRAHAPGKPNPNSCDQALTFLERQDATNSSQWYRSCLALVANAYGWGYSGVDTAGAHAALIERAGKMHSSRTGIPRGAVLWWTNGRAGHVAVYAGDGLIYSNDAVTPGQVNKVRWDLPEKKWGQHFAGWSAPYFPNAAGSVA